MGKKKLSARKKQAGGRKGPHKELAEIVAAMQEILGWQRELVLAAANELKRLDAERPGSGG